MKTEVNLSDNFALQEIFGFVCVIIRRGKVDALNGYVMIKEAFTCM
jgi:hypothetical protein